VYSRYAVETVDACHEAEEVSMVLSQLFQPEKVGPRSICGVQNATLDYQINEINVISGTVEKEKDKLRDCREVEAKLDKNTEAGKLKNQLEPTFAS
jgi:hypothetical protein